MSWERRTIVFLGAAIALAGGVLLHRETDATTATRTWYGLVPVLLAVAVQIALFVRVVRRDGCRCGARRQWLGVRAGSRR